VVDLDNNTDVVDLDNNTDVVDLDDDTDVVDTRCDLVARLNSRVIMVAEGVEGMCLWIIGFGFLAIFLLDVDMAVVVKG
jgi:hypothetical protein